jgi:general secretion pathway protein B
MLPAPVPPGEALPLPPSVAAARQAAAPAAPAALGGLPGAGSSRPGAGAVPVREATPAALGMPAAPAAPAQEERVYGVNELPEAIRRDWPSLAIGGSIYSETPSSRFLVINGRIFHEGDEVARDLSLEQIRLKAAVLRYRGYRVRITY